MQKVASSNSSSDLQKFKAHEAAVSIREVELLTLFGQRLVLDVRFDEAIVERIRVEAREGVVLWMQRGRESQPRLRPAPHLLGKGEGRKRARSSATTRFIVRVRPVCPSRVGKSTTRAE